MVVRSPHRPPRISLTVGGVRSSRGARFCVCDGECGGVAAVFFESMDKTNFDPYTFRKDFLSKDRKEGAYDFVTSLGDRVDGFVGNLIDVLLDPAPSDVIEKHSPGTGDHAETHRLRGECE